MKPFLLSLILHFWKGLSTIHSLVDSILVLRYFPKIYRFFCVSLITRLVPKRRNHQYHNFHIAEMKFKKKKKEEEKRKRSNPRNSHNTMRPELDT